MGMAATPEEAWTSRPSIPKIGLVAPPQDALTFSGSPVAAEDGDLTARIVSLGNVHRALPLTGALCTAVAARIEGTVVHRCTRPAADPEADLRIIHPSGIIEVAASVRQDRKSTRLNSSH